MPTRGQIERRFGSVHNYRAMKLRERDAEVARKMVKSHPETYTMYASHMRDNIKDSSESKKKK